MFESIHSNRVCGHDENFLCCDSDVEGSIKVIDLKDGYKVVGERRIHKKKVGCITVSGGEESKEGRKGLPRVLISTASPSTNVRLTLLPSFQPFLVLYRGQTPTTLQFIDCYDGYVVGGSREGATVHVWDAGEVVSVGVFGVLSNALSPGGKGERSRSSSKIDSTVNARRR